MSQKGPKSRIEMNLSEMKLLLGSLILLIVQCDIVLEKTDLVEINEQDPIVHEFKKSNIRFEYEENTFGNDKRRRIGAGSGFDFEKLRTLDFNSDKSWWFLAVFDDIR